MMRRLFLKWFGGAAAGAAIVAGPKVAQAMQRPEDPLEQGSMTFQQKTFPRHLTCVAFSEENLRDLGWDINKLTRKNLLRVDELIRSIGAVPSDAVLETVFPEVPNQLAIIFRYWHRSFQLVHSFDVISCEGIDSEKFKRFIRR